MTRYDGIIAQSSTHDQSEDPALKAPAGDSPGQRTGLR